MYRSDPVSSFHSILYRFVSDLHRSMLYATEPDILRNKRRIFSALSGKLKISKVSYFGLQNQINQTTAHVWAIAVTSIRHCILQMARIMSYQSDTTRNSDLIHEQLIISVLNITNLTMALTVKLYSIWTFWVAKICKERKHVLYVWNCNMPPPYLLRCIFKKEGGVTNIRNVISVKCSWRKIPARCRVSFGGYSVFLER
jgi:hypothetical protein